MDQPPGCGGSSPLNEEALQRKSSQILGALPAHIPQVLHACFLFHEFFPHFHVLAAYPEIYRRPTRIASRPNLW